MTSLKYNPNNENIFDYTKEKTDYKTNLKTNYLTDPAKVTKQKKYSYKYGPYGMFTGWGYKTVTDWDKINKHKKWNTENKETNKKNKKLNNKNEKLNKAYKKVRMVAKNTSTGQYAEKRNIIRDYVENNFEGPFAKAGKEALKDFEGQYKEFYRDQKLHVWDSNLGSQPPYGKFDPKFYGKTYAGVSKKYKQYADDDDIDVTEGYGKENYFYWHYTQKGKAAGNRGNEAEQAANVIDYFEETPEFAEGGWADQTDAELAFIRDNQLGIGENQTERFLAVEEINNLWEQAKQDSAEGKSNYFIELGKENFLDVNQPDEFVALFRLSDDPDHKQISFDYSLENGQETGITDLEDAITGTIGEQGIVDTKRFAALNQNVLKDSIEQLKKAKLKEQELDMLSGFGTFNEIFDINKTLTDSLLNDTGIGGYLPFTGEKGGFDAESLEDQFKGVTGVRNEVVYNWQNWFDSAIKEKYQQDLDLGFSVEEAENNVQIQKAFAESYIKDYLQPRFDESRSMNEFVEYLDVRQEEQNPFQTQSLLNALKEVGNLQAKTFLDKLRENAQTAGKGKAFNSEFYFDPTVSSIGSEQTEYSKENQRYINQRDTVSSDWDQAKGNPDSQIEGLGYDTTWGAQAYRYGLDINNKDQFARLHYQVKGIHMKDDDGNSIPFDGAEDIVNYDKVKGYLYDKILPALESEAQNTKTIFGNFIKPEEFADDMLEGLDPNQPETWDAALKELGLEDFDGTLEDLKEYITSTLSTGSAEDIRAQIKFLNEKRKKPTQYLLGVEYIAREEDYKPAEKLKGDTQLYKIFQGAGYEGTEDEFYENVFPDLDPGSQAVLSQVGAKDGKITLEGFGTDYKSDPFAAFAGVSKLAGEDPDLFGGESKEGEQSEANTFKLFSDDDEEDDDKSIFDSYKKTKSGQDILNEYKKNFNFGSFF